MIIPKQFLKTIKRTGLGANLFDECVLIMTAMKSRFILNTAPYRDASILLPVIILVVGQAVSMRHGRSDYGIRAVIDQFADIFYNNCFKNGILPIVVDDRDALMADAKDAEEHNLDIDLVEQVIRRPNRPLFPSILIPSASNACSTGLMILV